MEFVQLDAQTNRVASYLVDLVGEPRDDSFTLSDLALLSLETSLCRLVLIMVIDLLAGQGVDLLAAPSARSDPCIGVVHG